MSQVWICHMYGYLLIFSTLVTFPHSASIQGRLRHSNTLSHITWYPPIKIVIWRFNKHLAWLNNPPSFIHPPPSAFPPPPPTSPHLSAPEARLGPCVTLWLAGRRPLGGAGGGAGGGTRSAVISQSAVLCVSIFWSEDQLGEAITSQKNICRENGKDSKNTTITEASTLQIAWSNEFTRSTSSKKKVCCFLFFPLFIF